MRYIRPDTNQTPFVGLFLETSSCLIHARELSYLQRPGNRSSSLMFLDAQVS